MGRRKMQSLRELDVFGWIKLVIFAQTFVFLAGFVSWQVRDIPTLYRSSAVSVLLSDFRPILDSDMLNKEVGSKASQPPEVADIDLTLVMASRNDGYGGNASHTRAQLALDMIDYHLGVYRSLKVELILVEWNPAPDSKPYNEVFRLPKNLASMRFVPVPKIVHDMWSSPLIHGNYSFVPFHEFIAKNIGIRRARGRYVMGHAMDTILSDGFWKMMATHEIEKIEQQYNNKAVLFRAVRVETVDDGTSYELKVQKKRVKEKKRNLNKKKKKKDVQRALTDSSKIVWGIWDHSLSVNSLNRWFYLMMDLYMKFRHFSEASGDFQLMRREHWFKICGYPEAPTYGHFDTALMYQAHLLGFKVHLLRSPVFIFHSLHQGGFHERIASVSNPTYRGLYRTKLKLNPADWGLPGVRFREVEYQFGSRVDFNKEESKKTNTEGHRKILESEEEQEQQELEDNRVK